MERIVGSASLKKYFNSDYIGAYSIEPGIEPILTIESLWYGEITLAQGRKEPHVVVRFKEKAVKGVEEVKPLILNATNRKALKKAYGADTAEVLEGKPIQLYIDPRVRDPQDGGFTEGIRIRPYQPRECKCQGCGNIITAYGSKGAVEMCEYTQKNYGKKLCADCAKREAEKKKAESEKNETDE